MTTLTCFGSGCLTSCQSHNVTGIAEERDPISWYIRTYMRSTGVSKMSSSNVVQNRSAVMSGISQLN